jgi:hypothetical protein
VSRTTTPASTAGTAAALYLIDAHQISPGSWTASVTRIVGEQAARKLTTSRARTREAAVLEAVRSVRMVRRMGSL